MVSAGVIDTRPVQQIKESRKLEFGSQDNDSNHTSQLLEVKDKDTPHIITNNPSFFTSKEKVPKESRGIWNK